MSDVFKIFKKEMDKIFRFPRMIFTSLLLPGFMIFIIYAFIGQGMQAELDRTEEYIGQITIINVPDSLDFAFNNASTFKLVFEEKPESELNSLIELVKAGTIDVLVVYPSNFDQDVNNSLDPEIAIYYDSSKTNSGVSYSKMQAIISIQRNNFLESLSIDPNIFAVTDHVVVEDSKMAAKILSMILPMLIISFIFAGALSIGSDAIAGEKERGTLATLLMAPISRTKVIIGKILSTAVLTIFSAISSFVGIIASLPFAKAMFAIEGSLSYSIWDYLGILLILIVLSMLASSVLLISSTIAKTVKEATMFAMPIYLASIMLPVLTMFSETISDKFWHYLIPIYNCTIGLKALLSMEISLVNYSLIIGSSIVFIGLTIFLLIKLFKSEKVLFSK
ncbi:MAG: ABC transporter permease [Bacilli bacterium]